MAREKNTGLYDDLLPAQRSEQSVSETRTESSAKKTAGFAVIPTTGEIDGTISGYPSQENCNYPTIVMGPEEYMEYLTSIKNGVQKNKVPKTKRITLILTDTNYDYLFYESKRRGLSMMELCNEIIAKYSVSSEGHAVLK